MDFEPLFLLLACSFTFGGVCWVARVILMKHVSTAAEEETVQALTLAACVFCWYGISVSFTLFNKWFMSMFLGGVDFPLVITTFHLALQCLLLSGWRYLVRRDATTFKVDWFSSKFASVVVLGAATGVEIALSNESIQYLTVTMYTTIKSTVLVFIYFFSVYFRLESFRWPVFVSVLLVCVGVGMAVLSTVEFSLIGSLLCLAASLTAGLRWSLMQLLMKEEQQEDSRSRNSTSHIFAILFHVTPYAALAMVPVGAALEGGQFITYMEALSSHDQLLVAGTIAGGGFVALLLITVEMTIIGLTSSLTMSVLGQVKEVTLIVLSVLIFGDKVTLRTAVGILVSLSAACYYKLLRSSLAPEDSSVGLAKGSLSEEEESTLLPQIAVRSELELSPPCVLEISSYQNTS